jgi:hypothetical protein
MDRVGTGVLDGVGDRLLDDPIDRGFELRFVPSGDATGLEVEVDDQLDLDAGGAGPVGERLERRPRAELVERRRPDVGNDAPQAGDLGVELLDGVGER